MSSRLCVNCGLNEYSGGSEKLCTSCLRVLPRVDCKYCRIDFHLLAATDDDEDESDDAVVQPARSAAANSSLPTSSSATAMDIDGDGGDGPAGAADADVAMSGGGGGAASTAPVSVALTLSSLSRHACSDCRAKEAALGQPRACVYCDVLAAWSADNKCNRCIMSEAEYGAPVKCQRCALVCAFEKSREQRDKVGGETLCFLCTRQFKHERAKAARSEQRAALVSVADWKQRVRQLQTELDAKKADYKRRAKGVKRDHDTAVARARQEAADATRDMAVARGATEQARIALNATALQREAALADDRRYRDEHEADAILLENLSSELRASQDALRAHKDAVARAALDAQIGKVLEGGAAAMAPVKTEEAEEDDEDRPQQ